MRQRLIGTLKSAVNFLDRHPALRKPFFWATFYNLRLWYPVQYLLLRDLMDCDSVLDLGCGRHSMVPIVPARIYTTGVEFFEPHYREAVAKGRHKEYIHADVTKVEIKDKSFDAVVLLDVLEHLPKQEGDALIEKMQRWARKKIILFTPNGFFPQEAYDANPLMAHRSGWTTEEFRLKGFRVRGVRGFKSSYGGGFHGLDGPGGFTSYRDLAQVFTYHFPEKAFQLYCVKTLSEPPAGAKL